MEQRKMDAIWLSISIVGFFLLSVSFLLMPFPLTGVLPGILFWFGLAVGVLTQVLLEKNRRAFFAYYKADRKKMQKCRCGAFVFFSNKIAIVADIAMPVCVIGLALSLGLTHSSGYTCYVFLALTVFSFCMHCVFNGRNYFHVKKYQRVRLELEQRMANIIKKKERKENET